MKVCVLPFPISRVCVLVKRVHSCARSLQACQACALVCAFSSSVYTRVRIPFKHIHSFASSHQTHTPCAFQAQRFWLFRACLIATFRNSQFIKYYFQQCWNVWNDAFPSGLDITRAALDCALAYEPKLTGTILKTRLDVQKVQLNKSGVQHTGLGNIQPVKRKLFSFFLREMWPEEIEVYHELNQQIKSGVC